MRCLFREQVHLHLHWQTNQGCVQHLGKMTVEPHQQYVHQKMSTQDEIGEWHEDRTIHPLLGMLNGDKLHVDDAFDIGQHEGEVHCHVVILCSSHIDCSWMHPSLSHGRE